MELYISPVIVHSCWRQQRNLLLGCLHSSSMVFVVFLFCSTALGYIRSPLARIYGGRPAIFSISEQTEGFLPKMIAWNFIQNENKTCQCLPKTHKLLFVAPKRIFLAPLVIIFRSFGGWRNEVVAFSYIKTSTEVACLKDR